MARFARQEGLMYLIRDTHWNNGLHFWHCDVDKLFRRQVIGIDESHT